MQEVSLTGRMVGDAIAMVSGECYFKVDTDANLPIPCFCNDKTAENMQKFLSDGDEITIEGKLHMVQFRSEPRPTLLVFARHISYGRKKKSLSERFTHI
jgi:single-stranded DNA-binding protein